MERFLDAPMVTAPWELDRAAMMLPQLKCVKDWLNSFGNQQFCPSTHMTTVRRLPPFTDMSVFLTNVCCGAHVDKIISVLAFFIFRMGL
jgi:hypothetical protein